MLRWEKDINGYNGNWMGGYIGFDDGCPLYRVGRDDNGWYYEFLAGSRADMSLNAYATRDITE